MYIHNIYKYMYILLNGRMYCIYLYVLLIPTTEGSCITSETFAY